MLEQTETTVAWQDNESCEFCVQTPTCPKICRVNYDVSYEVFGNAGWQPIQDENLIARIQAAVQRQLIHEEHMV